MLYFPLLNKQTNRHKHVTYPESSWKCLNIFDFLLQNHRWHHKAMAWTVCLLYNSLKLVTKNTVLQFRVFSAQLSNKNHCKSSLSLSLIWWIKLKFIFWSHTYYFSFAEHDHDPIPNSMSIYSIPNQNCRPYQ